MGTQYFKNPRIASSPAYMEARAMSASQYAGRTAGMGAQRDLAAAQALSRTNFKPNTQSGAYPRGAKV